MVRFCLLKFVLLQIYLKYLPFKKRGFQVYRHLVTSQKAHSADQTFQYVFLFFSFYFFFLICQNLPKRRLCLFCMAFTAVNIISEISPILPVSPTGHSCTQSPPAVQLTWSIVSWDFKVTHFMGGDGEYPWQPARWTQNFLFEHFKFCFKLVIDDSIHNGVRLQLRQATWNPTSTQS